MEHLHTIVCKLCEDIFRLPEDDVEGNLPRALLCGHVFCTVCLLSYECDNAIQCPECEVESTLSEMGVFGLQEDCKIIGLIYMAKLNRMKSSAQLEISNHHQSKENSRDVSPAEDTEELVDMEKNEDMVDEALIKATENIGKLKHVDKILTNLSEEEKKDSARLELEIELASVKAVLAVEKWKEVQLSKVKKSCSSLNATQYKVQRRIKAMELAIQKAKEVCRLPFLMQYCTINKILEILEAPGDDQLIDIHCFTMRPKRSCVFNAEDLDQRLTMSLQMEGSPNKDSSPLIYRMPNSSQQNPRRKSTVSRNKNSQRVSNLQCWAQKQPEVNFNKASSPIVLPWSINLPRQSTPSPSESLDVIIEDIVEEEKDEVPPLTGLELGKNREKGDTGRWNLQPEINGKLWVMVTHIVNPSHFYIQYVTEQKDRKTISQKIKCILARENCHFAPSDTVETGSPVLAQYDDGLWSRARVVKIWQNGYREVVNNCHITNFDNFDVFFLDYGVTQTMSVKSEKELSINSKLKILNSVLRKLDKEAEVELGCFAPQAIRCSFKDLVPYDWTKGWTREAQKVFGDVVCEAVVEMRLFGQNKEILLVDLKKTAMDQSSTGIISVREYLVFMEVARFYPQVTLDKRPLSYDPPIHPEINTLCDAVVSHVNSPSDFYLQLVNDMEFLFLSTKLQNCYSATSELEVEENTMYSPVIGGACVALFDNMWYRAQVLDLIGESEVEVLYVDFGSKKILPVCDLRTIKDRFFALPRMAIHCCMSDIIPVDGGAWSDTCTSRFISLSYQQLVAAMATGTTTKMEPLPVLLFKGGVGEPQTSIADLLIKESLACLNEGLLTCCDDSTVWDPPLGLSLPEENVSASEQVNLDEQLDLLSQQKNLNVRVTHVNSPSSFYVQFTQFDSHLERISDLVKECALCDSQDVEWQADMYCAAKINGVWERGQLCSDIQTASNEAEVRRCDHGNTVKALISQLQPLPSSLIGSMALECKLHDIRPAGGRATWTDTACDLFSHYLTGALAVLTFKELTEEPPVPVTLLCSNTAGQMIRMSDFMMGEGLALREWKPRDAVIPPVVKAAEIDDLPVEEKSSPSSSGSSAAASPTVSQPTFAVSSEIPPKPASCSVMSPEMVKTSLYSPPDLPFLGQILVKVSSVGDDGMIYVSTRTAERHLEHLQERIQKSMKTLPRHKRYTWKSVQGCAVFGSDMLWYRGQLLEVLGEYVKVLYVDCGLVENLPMVHVYPVLLCNDVPQLSLPCLLRDITPVGETWQKDAVDLMKEMLVDRSVEMLVKKLPSDSRGPLMVELFLDGLSLSSILCHHQHGFTDGALSPEMGQGQVLDSPILDEYDFTTEGLIEPEEPMIESFVNPILPYAGERFKVRVTHLCTPNELFLLPLEGSAHDDNSEDLKEALDRINTDIHSLPHLTSFCLGAACLAKYSDGKYYRARLMDFASVDPPKLLIQHVDFGSDEILSTKQLLQIPSELLRFPCQALKVKVGGFKAASVSPEEEVLPYSPQWSIKAMMEMLNLLHDNITATAVALKPQLNVRLYNEDGRLVHSPLIHMGLAEHD